MEPTPTTQTPGPAVPAGTFFGHPRGLATLFSIEMWERFSFYGIRPLLILYMIAALGEGGFGFERPYAAAIVGIYASCVYLTSLPGGWVADRLLGLRRGIWYGGILIALGHLSIALSAFFDHRTFFLGLVFIVLGTGLLKPNVSAIVGDLYPEGGARRDAGFSVFYMGINVGATFAPLVTGFLRVQYGWHIGFGAAGVGMLLGLIIFRIRAKDTLGELGTLATGTPAQQRLAKNVLWGGAAVILAVIVLAMTGIMPVNPPVVASAMTKIILAMALTYFAYLFFFAGLTTDEKKRIAVIVVLFFFATVFWAAFEQAPTSLNLFAKEFTDRSLFGITVPPETLQSVNSFMVIIFAPIFGWLWLAMSKRGINPSSPTKFTWGLIFAGLGFGVMLLAANKVIAGGAAVRVSMLWLSASYLLQTFGELSLSPVGLSSMTKLAPRRFVGQMMGVWFMAAALGNLIAGLVGGNIDPNKLEEMPILFQRTTLSLFIAAAILGALIIPIRKMMRESSMASH